MLAVVLGGGRRESGCRIVLPTFVALGKPLFFYRKRGMFSLTLACVKTEKEQNTSLLGEVLVACELVFKNG